MSGTIFMKVPFLCERRNGMHFTLAIAADGTIDFFPDAFFMSGKRRGTSTPDINVRPKGMSGTGKPSPDPPTLTGSGRGTRHPIGRELSAKDELAEARQALAFFAGEIERLYRLLKPSDAMAEAIKTRLVASHVDGNAPGLNLAPDRIALRRSLFAQLADLSQEWGPQRRERSEAKAQMRRLERLVEALTRAVEREARKRKPAHG